MKKQLLALLMTAVLSAVAFAGPSINPYFEINIDDMNAVTPTLDAGVSVEGMLSPAWFVELAGEYDDQNLLSATNGFGLGFDANIGFDKLVTVDQTGSLVYGLLVSFGSYATYLDVTYPTLLELQSRTTGFELEGYVGPLTVWGGIDFPWTVDTGWLAIVPFIGIRVEFDIDL